MSRLLAFTVPGPWALLGVACGVLLLAALGLLVLERRQARATSRMDGLEARLVELESFSRSVDPEQRDRRGRDLVQLLQGLLSQHRSPVDAHVEPAGPERPDSASGSPEEKTSEMGEGAA